MKRNIDRYIHRTTPCFWGFIALLFASLHSLSGWAVPALSANNDEEVYIIVQSMPVFPGGQKALTDFIQANMDYPVTAWENNIQGRAICQFVVRKDGSIGDVEVMRSTGDVTLDKEAIRIIQSMPQWTPGKQNGSNVNVKYTLPVTFNKSGLTSRPAHHYTPSTPKTTPSVTLPAAPSNQPPLLTFVNGSLSFVDPSRNNRIEAGETCHLHFRIANSGKGNATHCEVRVKLRGNKDGITANTLQLPTIAVGQTYEVNIPISADINTQDGNVIFTIEVYEPNGWGVAPFDLTVATKAYEQPLLQVVDYNITSISGKIKKMEPFTLTFNLQNTRYGDAEQVKVHILLPANVFVMDGSAEMAFPLIKSGEAKPITLTLAANNNYPTTNIPITIDIQERYGKFAENKQLDIALNQTTGSSIQIAAKDEPQEAREQIQLAMLSSDVDRNIPLTQTTNPNTFALIIANEHYQRVASVPYALNDGSIFREYCIKTLGIPESNIHYVEDASYNDIRIQLAWMKDVCDAFEGKASVIVYYAGHGIPDEANKSAYLLPVDGDGRYVQSAYKLDDLYQKLGAMQAQSVTVFMDACFSGSKREEGMLASARAVAIKVRSGEPQGKMVVFSAAQGDETAYPNNDEQHGMFTYYLLKKLQETKGDVTLQELGNYITTNVRQQSIVKNGKSQTPTVTPSYTLGSDWQNWKLK